VRLLLRDEHLAIVDKPSGLLVHRGGFADAGADAAVQQARALLGAFVFPVHRLDRGASGVLVFALSSDVAAALHAAFEEGRVEKRYLAIVRGRAPEDVLVDHPIPRREDGPRVPATTHIRRLAVALRASLVEARPHTGRLHQVRRHLKHLSHPILGDANYGELRANRAARAEHGLARLALHAAGLRFLHPVLGTWVEVEAPLPDDLAGPAASLGLLEEVAHAVPPDAGRPAR
jgi:tRNA pseudouridine65 synthase